MHLNKDYLMSNLIVQCTKIYKRIILYEIKVIKYFIKFIIMKKIPIPKKNKKKLTAHNDTRIDNYYWLKR